MQFCTAYLSSGCACIEDVNISGVSATDTDRMISMFANNGAYIKDVTVENVRSKACSMSYIHQNDGTIDNVRLSNVEITAFDRYEHLENDVLDMRGHYIFSIRNAKGLILDNVRIFGDFKQKSARCEMLGCDDAEIRNCKL